VTGTPPSVPCDPAAVSEKLVEPADERRAALVGGAVFLVSGASLVVHILTGAPLWALLAALVAGGCLAAARFVWAVPAARADWVAKVRVGAGVGLVATGAYDLSRWALVQLGGFQLSPFKALPFFGEALLGGLGDPTARTVVGVGFHLLNGVTFGIAYTAWFGGRRPWWGVPFALGLEAFMLALYPGWLDVRSVQELTQISLFGHVVYGLVLGFGTSWALRGRTAVPAPRAAPS
jgi:hypothetical protein